MNIQKLDTHTYKELFADAVKEWKQRSGDEELFPSDVSYTLLEMQTMLVDVLNYYSDQVQAAHIKKYERLQGHREAELCPVPLAFRMQPKQPMMLWEGTQFPVSMGETVLMLETMHSYQLFPNEICSIYVEKDTKAENITELLRALEGTYTLSLQASVCSLYIRIKDPLPKNISCSLYICVENSCVENVEVEWPDMAELYVEYFSIHGWQKVCELHDATHALQCDGELRFQTGKDMVESTCFEECGFWLRLRIKEKCLDHPIGLQAIWMNTVLLKAQNTLAKSWELPSLAMTHIHISGDIAKEQVMLQIQGMDKCWRLHPHRRVQSQHDCCFYWEAFPKDIIAARLIAQREELRHKASTFTLNGICSQSIALAPLSTYRLAFLMEPGVWQDGDIIDRYEKGSGGMGCYRTENGICMGNGRDFQLPLAAENALLFTDFVQKQENFTLHRETIQVYLPHLTGSNARSTPLYEIPYEQPGIFFHKEELVQFLLQYPLLSISEVRVQTKPGQWMIHILDTCNHACHIPAYRCYVQRLVQQHVPFTDRVCVEDIHIQELCIALRIQVLASSQTKNQLEAACKDYIQDCRVQKQDLYAANLLQELRKNSPVEIIHCCFQRDHDYERLPYQAAVSYRLKAVVIAQGI